MATDSIDSAFFKPNGKSTQPELLISAVLHLISHYTVNANEAGACVKLASVIERHLKALADLPDLAPVLRATCEQLSEHWAGMVERTMPKPQKVRLFGLLASD